MQKKLGRDPLDLYCGVNMQGGEPGGTSWSLLPDQRVSIGLWGAHSYNMFWESRSELGSSDEKKQFAYLRRTECYFGGGNRNPVITPSIVDKHQCTAYNPTWHGMAAFMTARSPLSWDLAEEPFITYFNLGNGKFFNLNGERKTSTPWYNVGMQDYLPTWHFWFANKLPDVQQLTFRLRASTLSSYGTTLTSEVLHSRCSVQQLTSISTSSRQSTL